MFKFKVLLKSEYNDSRTYLFDLLLGSKIYAIVPISKTEIAVYCKNIDEANNMHDKLHGFIVSTIQECIEIEEN
jgi:hypothetical protein